MLLKSQSDSRSQKIILWREQIARLPDETFFNIMRLYLGELKTPYNKQKLSESLSLFVAKEENKKNILSLISDGDLRFISAVRNISRPTEEKLIKFFEGEKNAVKVRNRLKNLVERLVLYIFFDEENKINYYKINPLLEEALAPYTEIETLLIRPVCKTETENFPQTLTPLFMASFISCLFKNPSICKNDGSLKKKDKENFSSLFGNGYKSECFEKLFRSFMNLGLLVQKEETLFLDSEKTEYFSLLKPKVQLSYLCAASSAHYSRTFMAEKAKIFSDVLESAWEDGWTRSNFMHLAFLIQDRESSSVKKTGYLSRLLAGSADKTEGEESEGIFSLMLDSAIDFGAVAEKGRTESGEAVYVLNPFFNDFNIDDSVRPLSLDSSFSVILLPGLSLSKMIPLMKFMDLVHYDTAGTFEITRQSAMRGFSLGIKAETAIEYINSVSNYQAGKNFQIAFEEWEQSYSSAMLYKGYVLKVEKREEELLENNSPLSKFVKEKLAPGIYLMNFQNDSSALNFLRGSGFENISSIKTAQEEEKILPFKNFEISKFTFQTIKNAGLEEEKKFLRNSEKETEDFLDSLKKKVSLLSASQEQKDVLEERIERRLVVNENQLVPESVRFEVTEAYGMDYAGKIHLLESAIEKGAAVEMWFDDGEDNCLVGLPLELDKRNGEVRIRSKYNGREVNVAVARAGRIRKLKEKFTFD